MADLFSRNNSTIQKPVTADNCKITWDGEVHAAVQVQISYQQQVQRRRTIGNQDAIIYATYPIGQITIARLISDGAGDLFSKPGWSACKPGTITFAMSGGNGNTDCSVTGYSLTAKGCVVTQYSLSAEAEGLTVVDNVTIEFLELDRA
jgi:hypothetical protein